MLDMRIIIAAGRRRQTEADQALLDERLDDIHEVCRGRNTILIPTILPDGVVAMTHRLADKRGCMMEFFPFDYLKHPENGVELSNQKVIDHGADLLLALPDVPADGPSHETWDMVRRALGAGIETRIYPEACHE